MPIVTVNAGSSSVRLALFEAAAGGDMGARKNTHYPMMKGGEVEALRGLLSDAVDATPIVAHRVVHGGRQLTQPCRIDAAVEDEIERLAPLAPLHNPAALRWIRAARAAFGPDVEQVAVFDTAFFAELPEVAATYALPHDVCERWGLRRYGFHGLAHQALWRRWRALSPNNSAGQSNERVISFQLGAGSSIAALRDGRAQDTSMGFSPLEGLVMATRSGDIDPGLLLYLQSEIGLSSDDIETMLNRESGLLGLSGVSGDMRELLQSTSHAARLAIDVYCYRARKYLGAYLAVLGGADAILFGGGIGEHSPDIRGRILAGMEFAGIALSAEANAGVVGVEGRINAAHSSVGVHVIPVDEATVLAEEALRVVARQTEKQSRHSAGA